MTPERSLQQRHEALLRANDIRSARADLKKRMKAMGPTRSVGEAIALVGQPRPEIETMKTADLLLALPRVGRVKRNKLLSSAQISPSKTLGGLSPRQREELARQLALSEARRAKKATYA